MVSSCVRAGSDVGVARGGIKATGEGGGAAKEGMISTVVDEGGGGALASGTASALLLEVWSLLEPELEPPAPGIPVDPASVLRPLDLNHTSST